MTTEYIPPMALDVERTVLGSMMTQYGNALDTAIELLDKDCFYNEANEIIFTCFKSMHERDISIDVVTAASELASRGELEKVGSEPYIAELCDNVATVVNIEHHCKILIDKRNRRKIISISAEIKEAALNPEIDLKSEMSKSFFIDFIFTEDKTKIVKASDFAEEISSDFESGHIYDIYDTGWSTLPIKLALGRLNTWTGIPNVGKSDIVDALMVNTAKLHGWKWLVYSPENFPVKTHIVKIAEKFAEKRFVNGAWRMNREELTKALHFIEDHFDFVNISDVRFSSNEILAFTRYYLKKNKIHGLVIDPFVSLQLDVKAGENRTYAIGDFLESYRSIARKFEVSANIIAHPSKLLKNPHNAKSNPNWYDPVTPYQIDGSGNWFNTSDVCFSLWRNYRENKPILYVFKRRFWYDGDVGSAEFNWNPLNGCFSVVNQSITPDALQERLDF
jgi:replicative DNA helicase